MSGPTTASAIFAWGTPAPWYPPVAPSYLVCCPNLAGEIVEWVGFALLTWSLPGLAFALWTMANLVPRALWRRNWYHENFEGFPKKKAALFPGVL